MVAPAVRPGFCRVRMSAEGAALKIRANLRNKFPESPCRGCAAVHWNQKLCSAAPSALRSGLSVDPGLTAGATLVPRLRRCDSGHSWPAIINSWPAIINSRRAIINFWPAIIKSIASAPGAKRRHNGSPGREELSKNRFLQNYRSVFSITYEDEIRRFLNF